jgi:hypothetical protein
MAKRKAGSQIGNLTRDHKMSGVDPTSVRVSGVQHTVGKLSTKAKTFLQTLSQSEFEHEVIAPQSYGSSNLGNFGTPLRESRDKKPFGCSLRQEVQSILYGGRWWLPPSLGRGESCESEVVRDLS